VSIAVAASAFTDLYHKPGIALLPFYTALTFGTIAAFMLFDGSPSLSLDQTSPGAAVGVSVAVAVSAFLFGRVLLVPWCLRTITGGLLSARVTGHADAEANCPR
ncbi:hypothetical protein T484DRAFT_1791474, partial [Baffinella frigidus]